MGAGLVGKCDYRSMQVAHALKPRGAMGYRAHSTLRKLLFIIAGPKVSGLAGNALISNDVAGLEIKAEEFSTVLLVK